MTDRPIHPFPARMGPDLAIAELRRLRGPGTVLDPMAGSGTVLRHAAAAGHRTIGRDVDPLAVLMTRVSTSPVDPAEVSSAAASLIDIASKFSDRVVLPWMDDDDEMLEFTRFWFASPQRKTLRRLAAALQHLSQTDVYSASTLDVLRLAISRTIITKDAGASLARDVSHSRPHRVATSNKYNVQRGFLQAIRTILRRIRPLPKGTEASIEIGDSRCLDLPDASVDLVLTSPPYLNAIDYLRGHRMALIWLGHRLVDLRSIRGTSVGTERGLREELPEAVERATFHRARGMRHLPPRKRHMVRRFAGDLFEVLSEVRRVLRPGGRACFVVASSQISGVKVNNARLMERLGAVAELKLTSKRIRTLPVRHRYLPTPSNGENALALRMKEETVLRFRRCCDA